MKLAELLTKTTPLPWRIDNHGNVQADSTRRLSKICLTGFSLAGGNDAKEAEAEANNAYVHHAANALPELVEFVRFVSTIRQTASGWMFTGNEPLNGESSRIVTIFNLTDRAKAILAAAEEVTL